MKCRYEGAGVWKGRCVGTKEVDPCVGYEKCDRFRPSCKTNADHIRSMADDELADFANVQIGCGSGFFPCGLVCGGQCNSFDNDTCREKILNWLKQPHEADT